VETKNKDSVFSVTKKIMVKLDALSEYSSGKAALAKIRNSVGKPVNEVTEVWQLLFENLPEEFLGSRGTPSDEELSILTAIQLYALHKQGTSSKGNVEESEGFKNLGYSLGKLRIADGQTSIDRRFNSMITSTTFDELIHHLRHLIKILKAKVPDVSVNYAKLAEDLFWYLKGYEAEIRLKWAREYYRQNNKGEDNYEQE